MTAAADDRPPGVLDSTLPRGYRPRQAEQACWVEPRLDPSRVEPGQPLVATHAAVVDDLVRRVHQGVHEHLRAHKGLLP